MRIWLLTVGEPLPTDPGPPRLLRCGIIANLLAERGFEVVWWTANFRHTEKEKRFAETTAIQARPNLKIWCLDSRPYSRNVSFKRILSHRDVAAEFRRLAEQESPPDVLLASYPTPELAHAGAQYARRHGIPCVVDVRDLWPDSWRDALPTHLRPLADPALLLLRRQSSRAIELFDGICAITDGMMQWGLTRVGRDPGKWDRQFPLAYETTEYPSQVLGEAQTFWREKLESNAPTVRLCFFGNISRARGRLDVMIEAMKLLPMEIRTQTQLVMCGVGEALETFRQSAAGISEIVLPGWVNGPQIQVLAQRSQAGILPYPSDLDFRMSIPNKAIEYLAFGLPVLTSLQGPVTDLIRSEGCGSLYRETDPADLAATICRLCKAPEKLTEMAANSRRVFRERFDSKIVYGKFIAMLQQMAAAGRQRLPSA